jgi:hypothetical protein
MNATDSAALFECYVRTPDFLEHASTLELSPVLWDIFSLTEKRTTAADVSRNLGIEPAVAHLGLRELATHKLLRPHVQRWNEHRAAAAHVPPAAEPQPAPPPPIVARAPVPATPVPTPRPAPPHTPPPGPSLPTPLPAVAVRTAPVAPAPAPLHQTPPAAPVVPTAPLHPAAAAPREIRILIAADGSRRRPPADPAGLIRLALRRSPFAPVRTSAAPHATAAAPATTVGWPLRPILDAIGRKGGGGVTGQLLAYRVFLRIPADLLDRAGLHSLNLADNGFTIRDPELYAALRRSAREVAGVEVAVGTDASETSALACP